MKRLIIVILVLLVVALGGAGGLVMLGVVRNPFQKHPAEAATAQPAAETGADGFKAPSSQLQMVKVPDIIVPVIMDGEVTRRVTISMRMVAPDTVKRPLLIAGLPKFQNTMLEDLISYFQDYFAHADVVDVEAVRKKALSHATAIYGDAVSDVLMINVYETGAAATQGALLPSD